MVHAWPGALSVAVRVAAGVKQACCEFLDSQLDPSNCLGIRDFAETHGCADLMQAAEVFSQKHFPEVVQHEEFILLSQGEVEKLIKCDEIQVGAGCPAASRDGPGHPERLAEAPASVAGLRCAPARAPRAPSSSPELHARLIGMCLGSSSPSSLLKCMSPEGKNHWSAQRGLSVNWKGTRFFCRPSTHLTNIF